MWLINVVIIITFVFYILQIVSKAVRDKDVFLFIIIGLSIFFESIFLLYILLGETLSSLMQVLVLIFAYLIPMTLVTVRVLARKVKLKLVYNVAKFMYKIKNYEITEGLLDKVIDQDKNNAALYYLRGKSLEKLERLTEAKDMLMKAIELGINDKETYYDVAVILDKLEKKDMAILMLAGALKIDENYIDAKETLGLIYSDIGNVKDAMNIYEDIAESDEATAETFFNLAVMYSSKGEINKAIDSYKKAIELDDKLYEAYYSMGRLYYAEGKYIDAKQALENALKDEQLKAKVTYYLSMTNMKLNETEQALVNLKAAIELKEEYLDYAKREPVFTRIRREIYDIANGNNVQDDEIEEEAKPVDELEKTEIE